MRSLISEVILLVDMHSHITEDQVMNFQILQQS